MLGSRRTERKRDLTNRFRRGENECSDEDDDDDYADFEDESSSDEDGEDNDDDDEHYEPPGAVGQQCPRDVRRQLYDGFIKETEPFPPTLEISANEMKLLSSGVNTFVKIFAEIADEICEFTHTLNRLGKTYSFYTN